MLSPDDFHNVTGIIQKGADNEYNETAKAQRNRFTTLSNTEQTSSHANKKRVVNMSSKVLSDAQMGVLNKGLKFAVTPTVVPKKEMIVANESSLTKVEKSTADTVRVLAANMIEKSKPPKSNL